MRELLESSKLDKSKNWIYIKNSKGKAMISLENYSEEDKKFYESIGLLVAGEVTAEKASEISGYTFSTYMELLKRKRIFPFIYDRESHEMDLASIEDQLST